MIKGFFKSGKAVWVLGFMSGTSMDGVDVAMLRTDGEKIAQLGPTLSRPYGKKTVKAVQKAVAIAPRLHPSQTDHPLIQEASDLVTRAHIEVATELLANTKISAQLAGFHGQTLFHLPPNKRRPGYSWQIGDAQALSQALRWPVIYDFRSEDMRAGGEGAPLAPIYHYVLAKDWEKPIAIVNIGGVSNISWIGRREFDLMAFDCGPGNAPLDDWMRHQGNLPYDPEGRNARSGQRDKKCLEKLMGHAFFHAPPPKSLDRNAFQAQDWAGLSLADGAATLTHWIVAAIDKALAFCPAKPGAIVVTGGGRHNQFLMELLEQRLQLTVQSIDERGLDGDFIEAQAFAYMAVRRLRGLPLSFPTTTGVDRPVSGGHVAEFLAAK